MIYCFDLDGTLVTNTEDEDGNMHYTEAKPIPEAINRLKALYEKGHKIIIQTARGSKTKKFAKILQLGYTIFHENSYSYCSFANRASPCRDTIYGFI